MLLQGKVALITGASRGIGSEIAKEYAAQGAKVIINYNSNREKADEVLNDIIESGGTASIYQANVRDEKSVKNLVENVIEEHGRVDVLVNNAGVTNDKFLINMSKEEWDLVIETNLTASFLCSKHVIKHMMRNKYGKIINISSLSGILGNKGQINYSSSKAGLIGLTKTIAQEYSRKGISSNVIAPGLIDTDMTKGTMINEEEKEYKLSSILKGRPGKSVEVASVATFLASSMSDFINGEVIRVDGGVRF